MPSLTTCPYLVLRTKNSQRFALRRKPEYEIECKNEMRFVYKTNNIQNAPLRCNYELFILKLKLRSRSVPDMRLQRVDGPGVRRHVERTSREIRSAMLDARCECERVERSPDIPGCRKRIRSPEFRSSGIRPDRDTFKK